MSVVEALALTGKIGIIKPSRYLLNFSGPSSLIPSAANIRLSVTCEEASLPGRSLSTSEHRIYGPLKRIPYVSTFTNEFSLTFRVGTDLYEKRLFEEWMDFIVDKDTNDFNYYNNYVYTLDIMQLGNSMSNVDSTSITANDFLKNITNRVKGAVLTNLGINDFNNKALVRIGDEIPIYTARIFEVYPVSIQEITLGHAQNDQYARINVSFAFKKWDSIPDLSPEEISSSAPVSYTERDTRQIDARKITDIATRASQVFGIANNGQILPF